MPTLEDCINAYYRESLGPRLPGLLAEGRITQAVHDDFARRVENARSAAQRLAPDTKAPAHSVRGGATRQTPPTNT